MTAASSTRCLRSSILPRVMRDTSIEVVDEPDHVRLTCRSIMSCTLRRAAFAGREAQYLQRVANRRERRAQLVRERGQDSSLRRSASFSASRLSSTAVRAATCAEMSRE